MNRVKRRTCIVTGAVLGIGHTCAVRLAEEGAHLALFDVLDEAGRAFVDELQARGAPARYWHVDVANERSVQVAIEGESRFMTGAELVIRWRVYGSMR